MGILRRGLKALRVAVLFALAAGPVAAACAPDRIDIRGDWGSAAFTVDLAITPEEQARGLMFVEEMPRMSGMLFVYPQVSRLSFWMRNTLIPLDMIFIDETGTVINVHAEAIPLDETPINAERPGLAVLEINGGMAARFGISAGDQVRSQAMPQDIAVWACE